MSKQWSSVNTVCPASKFTFQLGHASTQDLKTYAAFRLAEYTITPHMSLFGCSQQDDQGRSAVTFSTHALMYIHSDTLTISLLEDCAPFLKMCLHFNT